MKLGGQPTLDAVPGCIEGKFSADLATKSLAMCAYTLRQGDWKINGVMTTSCEVVNAPWRYS